MQCSVLPLWLSSTLHTLKYSPLCFWYSQPPDSSHRTFLCWFPRLFCFRSITMEWPSPSSPTETLSGLLRIKAQGVSFSKPTDLPCFTYRAWCTVFLRLNWVSVVRLSRVSSFVQSLYSMLGACACVFRNVCTDTISRFIETFIIIIICMHARILHTHVQ